MVRALNLLVLRVRAVMLVLVGLPELAELGVTLVAPFIFCLVFWFSAEAAAVLLVEAEDDAGELVFYSFFGISGNSVVAELNRLLCEL